MKRIIILISLLLSATFFAQTITYENLSNSILSDSSDLPLGIANAGSKGGPVSFGVNYDNEIYFAQGSSFFKAEEGTENIETLEKSFLTDVVKSFKINGNNLYVIFDGNSDSKNKISKMIM